MPQVLFSWLDEKSSTSQRQEKVIQADGQITLLQLAVAHNIPLEANCGGKGRCGKCKVVVSGPVSPLDSAEAELLTQREKDSSVRLACRCYPRGDVKVEFVRSKDLDILTTGLCIDTELAPDIRVDSVDIASPTLECAESDWTRLKKAMGDGFSSAPTQQLLQRLPDLVREPGPWTVVKYQDRVLDIHPSGHGGIYGIAVDVGTTTVAVGLSNLETGEEVALAAAMNEQATYGADVISRIEQCADRAVLARMQEAVVETVNSVINELCSKAQVSSSQIYRAVVVGNTCMQHLFLGVDPRYLAHAPYVPVFSDMVTYPAFQLGLEIFPCGPVTLLPSIAGFVGADTVGMIMAADMAGLAGTHLAIDIGTNGEIVLSRDSTMYACSTAAGPAFEGGQILWGMRAAPGAIDRVWMGDTDLKFTTIQDRPAAGICGSGIIDLLAVLLDLGIVDESGRLLTRDQVENIPEAVKKRLVDGEHGPAFVVAWAEETKNGEPVLFTYRDVRQVQLAKGAIQAGYRILANKAGVDLERLDGVHLAGAFGNYIRRESAARIGLLPPVPAEKVRSLGNAARIGARMALLSQDKMHLSTELARNVRYIELSAMPEFQMEFMEAMMF